MGMLGTVYRGVTGALGLAPARWWPSSYGAAGPVAGVLHGASAGEVKAALSVLPHLEARSAKARWLVSTGTDAGMAMGAGCRLPRDLPPLVDHFFDHLRPRSIVLVEAELWPNLLQAAHDRGVPVGVLGARISDRSARRWAHVSGTARRLFSSVAAFAAASPGDADRLMDLGVPPDRVEVTGWLKWPEAVSAQQVEELGGVLKMSFNSSLQAAPLFVLGCVHPGELGRAVTALQGTELAAGRARWLVVPRHARAVRAVQREATRCCPKGAVSVETRFGVLRAWYRLADAALVGGGAAGRGVHDLLEPLQFGLRPLCFLRRGDPAGVGAVLAQEGLALVLDDAQFLAERAVPVACTPAPGAWDDLRRRWDGRASGVQFLASRGVLGS